MNLRKLRRLRLYFSRNPQNLFITSFLLGAFIAVILHHHQQTSRNVIQLERHFVQSHSITYEAWLRQNGLERRLVDPDVGRYNRSHKDEDSLDPTTEAYFLYGRVNVTCLVFPTDSLGALTVKETWGRHCNDISFFSHLTPNDTVPIVKLNGVRSSFHLLCRALDKLHRRSTDTWQWLLVASDDTFALVENLRYYVAPMDHDKPHYLGHAIKYWGQVYNWKDAGYVLSRGAVTAFLDRFGNCGDAESSVGAGGWSSEDWYLGKALAELGIVPEDTRDHLGRGRFNGYSFKRLIFPDGGSSLLDLPWRESLHLSQDGPECCSSWAVTFHGVTTNSKMYQLEYMFHHLRPFYNGGRHGNVEPRVHGPSNTFLTWEETLKDMAMERFLGGDNASTSNTETVMPAM